MSEDTQLLPDYELVDESIPRRFDEKEKAEAFMRKFSHGEVDDSLAIKPMVWKNGKPIKNRDYLDALFEIRTAVKKDDPKTAKLMMINLNSRRSKPVSNSIIIP